MSPKSGNSQNPVDSNDQGIFSPPRPGWSPLATICLLSAIYFFFCLIPDLKNALNVFCLGTYSFSLATLTGSLALREMKESKGAIKGRIFVYIGFALVAVRLLLIIFIN